MQDARHKKANTVTILPIPGSKVRKAKAEETPLYRFLIVGRFKTSVYFWDRRVHPVRTGSSFMDKVRTANASNVIISKKFEERRTC